jgi:hypothetical protein
MPYVSIVALLAGLSQAYLVCDDSCDAVIEAGVRWVADSRDVGLADIVVLIPSAERSPADAHRAAVLNRVSERLSLISATERPVSCEPRLDARTRAEFMSRCHMTRGQRIRPV